MFYRLLRLTVLTLFCFAVALCGGLALMGIFVEPLLAAPESSDIITPLPPGCIDGTPVDQPTPACCISGMVYVNGEPVRGAEIIIERTQGEPVIVQTDLQLTTERRPYYRHILSSLGVEPGDTITLTAKYSGYTRTVTHTVQPNGQQVDIALAPTILSFAGETQGEATDGKFNNVVDVALDSQGRIYATDLKNFRVQVFTPDGGPVNQWGGELGHLPTQFGRPSGIAIDQRSNLVYVVDTDNQRVLQYSAAGDLIDLWDNADLPVNQPWLGAPKDVTVDGKGNVYVLSRSGITKFDETGVLLAHWGAYSDGSTDRGDLDHLAASGQGEIYVPDRAKRIIHRFDVNGQPQPFPIQTITGTLVLSNPLGIAVDTQNQIYVYDGGRSRVLVVNANGSLIETLPRDTTNPIDHFPSDVSGIAVHNDMLYLAGFNEHRILRLSLTTGNFITPSIGSQDNGNKQIERPRGLAVGSQGEIFVTEPDLHRLTMLQSNIVTKSWTASDFGLPTWDPIDVVFDTQQQLWLLDNVQQGLVRFSVNGLQLTLNGQWKTFGAGNVDFCRPAAVDIDASNHLFVINGCNQTIYALHLVNNNLQPITAFTGTVASGPFNLPVGIAVDDSTNMVYIADANNNRIVQLHFTGSTLEFVRTWGEVGSTPGKFQQPWDVVVGQDGFLYVSDHGNHLIQKFDKSGVWQASYGTSGIGPGEWLNPTGLAMDSEGTLYGADEGLGRIQQLVAVSNTAPIATIIQTAATNLKQTAIFTATGQGQDSDATNIIDRYEWSSNRQGVLQSGKNPHLTIAATQLLTGPHLISLRVQDNEGVWSIPVSVRINVIPSVQSTACQGEMWTMLLYLVGDYQDGGQLGRIYAETIADLNGVDNPCVQIGIQMDGAASIGPSGSDTERWLIQPGVDPVNYAVGEQAMDDPTTLTAFISETQKLLPAQHYYLAIANHGQGILGLGWDHTTDYRRNPPQIENDAYLTAKEIATALADPHVAPIDILHLDACSMGLFDVAYELRASAHYLIAAQYLGWSIFAYDAYANLIPHTTAITPAALATAIVNHYAEVAELHQLPYTLSALTLAQTERIKAGVDELAVLLRGWADVDLSPDGERNRLLFALRNASQSFDSNGDFLNTAADAYIDLLDWVKKIRTAPQISEPAIQSAADQLIALFDEMNPNRFVIANRVDSAVLYLTNQLVTLDGANGISLYLPPGKQPSYGREYVAYLQNGLYGLTVASRWDNFLQTALGAPNDTDTLAALPVPLAPVPLPAPALPTQIFLPLIRR